MAEHMPTDITLRILIVAECLMVIAVFLHF